MWAALGDSPIDGWIARLSAQHFFSGLRCTAAARAGPATAHRFSDVDSSERKVNASTTRTLVQHCHCQTMIRVTQALTVAPSTPLTPPNTISSAPSHPDPLPWQPRPGMQILSGSGWTGASPCVAISAASYCAAVVLPLSGRRRAARDGWHDA